MSGIPDLALIQLRAAKGAHTRATRKFSQGGVPMASKGVPPITLRRADYDRQKAKEAPCRKL